MYPDPQRFENIISIRDAMRQISQEADAVVELLDARIEDEHLDGSTEAQDVRTVLELIQSLTLQQRSKALIQLPSWTGLGAITF